VDQRPEGPGNAQLTCVFFVDSLTSSKWAITIPSCRRDADVCALACRLSVGDVAFRGELAREDLGDSRARLLSICPLLPKQAKHEKHPDPKTSSAAVVSLDLFVVSIGCGDALPVRQDPGESTPGEYANLSPGEAEKR
jgi:hypothetical protein